MLRFYGSILCLCGWLACAAVPSRAALDAASFPAPVVPEAVTLYPAGARAFVTQNLPVINGSIRLSLPPGTLADSVFLNIEGRTVRGLSLTPAEVADSPEIKQLRDAYESARQTLRQLEGELSAVQSRKLLWTEPKTRFTKPDDVDHMDQLIAEKLPALYAAEQQIEVKLLPAKAEYQRLEQAMEEAGALDAQILLLSAQVSPAEAGTVRATLTYSLRRCGWRPVYRLEARPGNGKSLVRFVQEAEIRQGSGQDWNNVGLTLVMGDSNSSLDPAPNQSWRIQPRPKPDSMPKPRQMALSAAPAFEQAIAGDIPLGPMPAREQAAYTAWDLGPTDLPAGRATRLMLAEEDWPAVFTRLIRPVLGAQAYLLAKVTLPEPRALPVGTATYIVEGETAGRGSFSLAGHEADLFFGTDPRVSAKMTLDARQSGRKGFVDRRQTRVWSWTIEVKNAHKQAVAVRLEDAQPQAGDEAIAIEAVSSPAPRVENRIYVWELEIPAGGSQTLAHRITVSAPQDMDLQEGR